MDLYSDLPITTKEEDILNRNDFSCVIADYLLSPSSNNGLVLSINGEWGSGKTSIANMIKANISEKIFTKESKVIPIIVNYSPWNISNNDQIIKQFLNTLSDGFLYKRVLKIVGKILKVSSIIASLTPIPSAIKETAKNIDSTFSHYVKALNSNCGDLEEFKCQVEKYLRKSILRYIVFIDDIDRLNNHEIKILIQLIKSTCNFSNITYVLLYDKKIVSHALTGEQGNIDGTSYLKKIVQIEFNVPNVKHETIIELLGKDLEKLLSGKYKLDSGPRLQDFLSFGLFSQITTIRDEKRFMNCLAFVIESHVEEIDPIDLIVITYLRYIDDGVYELILKYEDCLLGTKSSLFDDKKNNQLKDAFFKELANTKLDNEKGKYILSELFPHMFSRIPEKHGKDYLAGRLCIPNIFHKYSNMDFDYEDMSLKKLNNIIKYMDSNALSIFAKELNPDQGRKLLYVLGDFSENLNDEMMFKQILKFLFNDFSTLNYSRPFLIVDKSYYVGKICNSLVHNIEIENAQKILLEEAASGSDIGALVWLCDYLTYRDQDRHFDFKSVSDDTISKLKEITMNKVLSAFDNNINAPYSDYNRIICFALINGESDLKKLIEKKDASWIAIFIAKSASVGQSYFNHRHHIFYRYDISLLKRVIDVENFNLVAQIKLSKDNSLKQRLIAFKMSVDGLIPEDADIKGFSVEEIQKYSSEKSIEFIASDDYEMPNVI